MSDKLEILCMLGCENACFVEESEKLQGDNILLKNLTLLAVTLAVRRNWLFVSLKSANL